MTNELRPGIHWVGAVEWSLRHFHGHELSITRGTSYNAYLIKDGDAVALIDTVKATHAAAFVRDLEKLVSIDQITHIIVCHAEPDHSGALPEIVKRAPKATVYCDRGGATTINRHYPGLTSPQIVKTGEVLKLGKRSLRFFEAQMLHWPDSMFAYCPEEEILFSNDAFGQHYASSSRFADEVDQAELWQEAMKYFANILTPYSGQIVKKVNEFLGMKWPIGMICPSHGQIWRKDVTKIVEKYVEWSSGKAEQSVVLLFDTIWHGTEKMAMAIVRGLDAEGIPYKIFNAGVSDFNDVNTEILRSHGLLIGSPTLNNNLMPTIAPFLESIRGLRFVNKIGAAFGTYGWSGEGCKRIEEIMTLGGIKIVQPNLRINYAPSDEELTKCIQFGRDFAAHLKEG
ncbi:MAG: MBL fold metallo-hydrolase [Candidatus Riflebacteria bacterium]|nr:MBL fold metallo-hydrolase [Candidatus Riflebacteria bacterium]